MQRGNKVKIQVKNKTEAFMQLKSFLGEERAKELIGGITKDLLKGEMVIVPLSENEPLILTGPTKESKAKERRRMYAKRAKRKKKRENTSNS